MVCRIVAEVCKTPDEEKVWGFDYSAFLARAWLPGTVYAPGVRIRPPNANGYEYESGGGQSGIRTPRFPTSGTIQDGSITWTTMPISNSSLRATIITSTWACADADIVLSDFAVESSNGAQATSAHVAGGVQGQEYEVINTVTMSDGSIEESGLTVEVS